MSGAKAENKKSYSATVHLPATEFPMRGDLPKREPQWLKHWEDNRIFEKMQEQAKDRTPFVLHDGPPYANGHIHIGHALNKILKDMTVKSQALMGRRTPYVPGWDCHGLPIEHALLKEKKMSKRGVEDLLAFRGEAAAFADRFIKIQLDEFRRLGVLGSWDQPYKTMSRKYEAGILKAFRLLYGKGYIYRGKKTVSWCCTCETALAEAEVEYKPKKSPSVFVAMPIVKSKLPFIPGKDEVLIWTTTPWTLPANKALAFNPSLRYVLIEFTLPKGKRRLLIAKDLLQDVAKTLEASEYEAVGEWSGKALVASGLVAQTPFGYLPDFKHQESKAVEALYVSAEDGTGVVHTAPGHGADDYSTGVKEGLEILCPIDTRGRYTDEAAGTGLEGLQIFKEGNAAVIEKLTEAGRMLNSTTISHSYQHCWRCKNPIAFRATEQWFLNVTHDGLREKLLQVIGQTQWVPAVGEERITAMVSSRPDWCLSRQRLWGTPIPVFRCQGCASVMADDDLLTAIEQKVATDGSDFWFKDRQQAVKFGQGEWAFAPEKTCSCGKAEWLRETDILDVWMDSGASWLAVLEEDQVPCELYLEGSDQHRGWFQSSLVMAVAMRGTAPYKTVLTHGFVLDDKGRAMHKSLGNVVAPQKIYEKLGADVLRLWAALADYSDDVRLSDKLLQGPTDTYRKIRNTFKYLLGSLSDFSPERDAVPFAELPELERWVLGRLGETETAVRASYNAFEFRKAAVQLVNFCNLQLSAFYMDARKDALYTLSADARLRRSAQTVMWHCLLRVVNLAAPILSFTCEEVWLEMQRGLKARGSSTQLEESVFLHALGDVPAEWADADLAKVWDIFLVVRGRVLKALEQARADKIIGSSLQAAVVYAPLDPPEAELLNRLGNEEVAQLMMVSTFRQEDEGGAAKISKAPGSKCPRCWRVRADIGTSTDDPALCARCVTQLAT